MHIIPIPDSFITISLPKNPSKYHPSTQLCDLFLPLCCLSPFAASYNKINLNKRNFLKNELKMDTYLICILVFDNLTVYNRNHPCAQFFSYSNATSGNLILGNISKFGKIHMHGNYSFSSIYNIPKKGML